MNKIAIIYWSQTGNTEMMAEMIATGLRSENQEVDIYTIGDFSDEDLSNYQTLVFGCPAMGNETLEENEFGPRFEQLIPSLIGKNLALFGSYDWGDGEWMRTWKEDCVNSGLNVIIEPLIAHLKPEEAECLEYGQKIVEAIR